MRVFGGQVVDEELRAEVKRLRGLVRFLLIVSLSLIAGFIITVSNYRNLQSDSTDSASVSDEEPQDLQALVEDLSRAQTQSVIELADRVTTLENQITSVQNDVSVAKENISILDNNIQILDQAISDIVASSADVTIIESKDEGPKSATVPEKYSRYWSIRGYVPQSVLDSIISNYELVPLNIRNAFENDGWKMIVVNGDLEIDEDLGDNSKVGAMTVYNDKVIYLTLYDPTSVIHEMGHFLDYKNNFCSLFFPAYVYADEWGKMIAVAEHTHVHNYSTTPEYFAESFNMWVTKHDAFCNACPGTARYLEEHMNI